MDEVEIVNYDPRWPILFEEEAKQLRAALDPSLIVGLEHFGSTAVPDLSAKPIIDILIAVRSLADAQASLVEALRNLDYVYWADNPKQDQKSIRRGEVEIAQRAALTFLGQRGSAIWRRYIVIAFEDIGAGSSDVVAMTVAASTDASWRKQSGGDIVVAAHLARLLAEAPKSRSAEHLITSSNDHPSLERERRAVSIRSIADNLAAVADKSNSLTHRALAGWCISGVGWEREKVPGSNLPTLLDTFRQLGVPEELVAATGIAATKSREPITLMVPLIWSAANDSQTPTVLKAAVPGTLVFGDIPMYALDKHTRIGQEAIRSLVKHNHEIRECLGKFVAPARWNAAAYMAAFYADAAPLASKLSWDGADQLEALGTETDLLLSGVTPESVVPLLKVFRENVDHLNKLRAHTICKKQGFVDVATVLMADLED